MTQCVTCRGPPLDSAGLGVVTVTAQVHQTDSKPVGGRGAGAAAGPLSLTAARAPDSGTGRISRACQCTVGAPILRGPDRSLSKHTAAVGYVVTRCRLTGLCRTLLVQWQAQVNCWCGSRDRLTPSQARRSSTVTAVTVTGRQPEPAPGWLRLYPAAGVRGPRLAFPFRVQQPAIQAAGRAAVSELVRSPIATRRVYH